MMEAAQIDGANGFQLHSLHHVAHAETHRGDPLPVCHRRILKGNFGLFYNLVGNNSMLFQTTDIIETYVYRSMMNSFNFSQSSAVGLFQSVVGFFIVIGANAFVKHLDPEYALF